MSGYLGNVNSSCFGKPWAQLLDLQEKKEGVTGKSKHQDMQGHINSHIRPIAAFKGKKKIDGRKENPNKYIKHYAPETFKRLSGKVSQTLSKIFSGRSSKLPDPEAQPRCIQQ